VDVRLVENLRTNLDNNILEGFDRIREGTG